MKIADDLKRYANSFQKNAVVLFPTDTVAGLGCRFDSVEAIERIRRIKGIPDKTPLALLISSERQLDLLKVRRSPLSNLLTKSFWPGGFTLVLSAEITYPCSGEADTLGLRMPDSELLRKIIDMVGVPIVATSANLHGEPAPANLSGVNETIREMVDHMIEFNVAAIGLASTVVKIEGGMVRILREGVVTRKEIIDVIGDKYKALDD